MASPYQYIISVLCGSSPGPRTLLNIPVHVRSLILTLVSTRTRFRTIFLKSIRISSVPVLRFSKPTRTRLVTVPDFENLSVSRRHLVRTLVRTHDGVEIRISTPGYASQAACSSLQGYMFIARLHRRDVLRHGLRYGFRGTLHNGLLERLRDGLHGM